MMNIFYDAVSAKIDVARLGVSKGKHGLTSKYLSQKLLISLEAAKITVKHTT